MKAYLMTICVLDFEDYGPDEYATLIKQHRNISATVVGTKTADIGEWDDDHPLNKRNTSIDEIKAYFQEEE